ncbi:MAG: DUF393 domain-containing protein [Candidatus Omnitrophica bacterium]|nr:DUF393 domain-containing protein [Candidatus Omnitrophota bacterium]
MQKPIIFFDGVCGLCNRFVDWMLKRDQKGIFLFAPLQGETAQEKNLFQYSNKSEELSSILFCDENGKIHRASSAILSILVRLGGLWNILGLLLIVPSCLRDSVYDFIARRRYQWFGQRASCRIPSEGEFKAFLP